MKVLRVGAALAGAVALAVVLAGCDSGPAPKAVEPAPSQSPPPVVHRTEGPSSTAPPPGTEGWGPVVARKGDVAVYAAVRDGNKLRVPMVIVNSGGASFYDVTLRVKGPNGYVATGTFSSDTVRLQPGDSLPTELTVSMPGRSAPEEPEVEIVEVEQRGG